MIITFSHYKSIGIFPHPPGQLAPQSKAKSDQITVIRDFMVVLVTCKNEEVPIKMEDTKSGDNIIHQFFRHSRAADSMVSGRI